MSVRIQYAYLKQQTWLEELPEGTAAPARAGPYKQSLKTGDARKPRRGPQRSTPSTRRSSPRPSLGR